MQSSSYTFNNKVAIGWGIAILILLYMNIAWMVFQWRNPKSNEMSFFRHFYAVMTLDKLDQYQ